MRQVTDDTSVRRIPLLDEGECEDVATRLDGLCAEWIRRSDDFFTLGAATYLDICAGDGSVELYRRRLEHSNPILDDVFADVLERVNATVEDVLQAPAEYADGLARPGFHIFLASSLDGSKRDVLHLDLQQRYLPLEVDVYAPSLTFTLPIELPASGAGIEFCRPDPADKRGRLEVVPYALGELLVHSGRTLHRRAHFPVSEACRRVTLQGHALLPNGGPWILYW